jgi:hypothetical protein
METQPPRPSCFEFLKTDSFRSPWPRIAVAPTNSYYCGPDELVLLWPRRGRLVGAKGWMSPSGPGVSCLTDMRLMKGNAGILNGTELLNFGRLRVRWMRS